MWKTLIEDGDYEINEEGAIRRKDNKRVRKTPVCGRGYCVIKLRRDSPTYYLHRLVAEHFVANDDPENKTAVNHIDGDRLNNKAENLEWVTYKENSNHYYQKTYKKKEHKRKVGEEVPILQMDKNGNILQRFSSITFAAKKIGISVGFPAKAVRGERPSAGGYFWKIDKGSTTMREENPSSPAQDTQLSDDIV